MTQANWEKAKNSDAPQSAAPERIKFIIGGVLLLGAVIYLVMSGTISGAQYFVTVDDVVHNADYAGQTVRISGAVLGDTIEFDAENLIIDFTVVNMSSEYSDLAAELNQAVNDTSRTRLDVHIEGEVLPDLLQHEAQAILTGSLGEDGVFYATELLLKCPSRYEEALPQQVAQNAG